MIALHKYKKKELWYPQSGATNPNLFNLILLNPLVKTGFEVATHWWRGRHVNHWTVTASPLQELFYPHSVYILAYFASGNTAKGIKGNRKNSKYAPLLRDLIEDTLPLIEEEEEEEEEKKALAPVVFELGTPRLWGRSLAISPPPLPHLQELVLSRKLPDQSFLRISQHLRRPCSCLERKSFEETCRKMSPEILFNKNVGCVCYHKFNEK